MKCLHCPLKYISQTGRIFYTTYKERIQAIRNNGHSEYSNHILYMEQTYGAITDTVDIIRTQKKGKHLNTL
jgi:hypothetical protein